MGGLQVTNSDLRYLELKFDPKGNQGNIFVTRSAALRLPPGIIEQGRIKDAANFIAALKALRKQIDPRFVSSVQSKMYVCPSCARYRGIVQAGRSRKSRPGQNF